MIKNVGSRLRVALLISGSGTTAQEIIRASKSGQLHVEPACVIASHMHAGGIKRALQEGVPRKDILIIRRRDYSSREAFGEVILEACRKRAIDVVGQYGWMEKTPANVIEVYSHMMINQHPGPLDPGRPDFGGKNMFGRRVHCARLWFVRRIQQDYWTEATAQRVAVEYDAGAILKIGRVEIVPTDDVFSLQERVLAQEHKIHIETLNDFVNGNIKEIVREKPLVSKEHEPLLVKAKQIAGLLFPRG